VQEIHIQVDLATTFPSREELALRHLLEAACKERVGPISGAGAGGGVMDVWVMVEDADRGTSEVAAVLAELAITDRTRVSLRVVDRAPADDTDVLPSAPEIAQEHVEAANSLVALGRAQGYITYDQMNDILPDDIITKEAIDTWLELLAREGIEVLDEPPPGKPTIRS
jgi:Sigma-70 factor, region 1.1